MNWTGGYIELLMNSSLSNSGTFTIATNNTLSGGGTVTNQGGQVIRQGGGGVAQITTRFNNLSGAVGIWVKSDTLEIDSSGSDSGTIQVDAGGKFIWGTGTRTFQAPVTLTGDGEVHIVQATVNVAPGDTLTSNVRLLSMDDDCELNGGIGAINGELSWTAGTIRGFALLTIAGAADHQGHGVNTNILLSNSNLILTGGTSWQSGDVNLVGATIQNYGNFSIECGYTMTSQGGGNAFENLDGGAQGRGRVSKSQGVGPLGFWPTTFETDFTNTGDLLFNDLTIRFKGKLTQDGTGVTNLAGGWLVMAGGQPFLQINGKIDTGGGLIIGNYINRFGAVATLSGDTLGVQGDFTQSGGTTTVGGTLSVTGTLTESGGVISLTGGNLQVAGGVTVTSGAQLYGSGTVTADVTNTGAVTVGGLDGSSGTVEVNGNYTQTDGTTTIQGTLLVDYALSLGGGLFSVGAGSVPGTVQVGGDSTQTDGTVSVAGNFLVNGTLSFDGGSFNLGNSAGSSTLGRRLVQAGGRHLSDDPRHNASDAGLPAGGWHLRALGLQRGHLGPDAVRRGDSDP